MSANGDRERSRPISFAAVALVFLGVFVVGLAVALWLHRTYVAADRVVAQHVPSDAAAVLRVDLEKATLFAPIRRSFLPLYDELGVPAGRELAPRGKRVERHADLVLARDTRELLVAWGPGEGSWAIVAGGNYPEGVLPAFERAFAEEGASWRRESALLHSATGPALGQGVDRTLVLGSSPARAASALVTSSNHRAKGVPERGALSFFGEPARLPWLARATRPLGSVARVEARADWSSPFVVDVDITFTGEPPADAESKVRALFVELVSQPEAARLARAAGELRFERRGRVLRVQTRWDHIGLEAVADSIARRLSVRNARIQG